MMRTHRCGDLRTEHIDEKVSVCGWVASRRDHGGVVFLDVRDAAGIVQVVVDPDTADGADPHQLRAEYVIRAEGVVRHRPEGTVNPDLATGEVEVAAMRLEVLNPAEPSPIPLERVEADEALRLKYRYLDLRRDRMQRNLRMRAVVNDAMRRSMIGQQFVEIETPMLIASTPEGARDFVVPSRLQPGSFYALPQSPQLFKQLLMVGGFDRYFQIARCLRDEDPRADRQFEFMQYDMEMSFADADDVMAVVTEAVQTAVEAVRGERAPAFRRMTWQESMDRFGVDKPDTRFGLEIVDVSECFEATEFRAFQTEVVKGIRVPGEGATGRGRLDTLTERAKQLGADGLVWMRVQENGGLDSPVAKFLSEAEQLCVVDALGAALGDLLLLVAGGWRRVDAVLGQLRLDLSRPPVTEGGLQFVWVVDFPLFEGIDGEGRPIPAHHPFTMPHPDDLQLLTTAAGDELLRARSLSYDLVQRVGARLGQRPNPFLRRAGASVHAPRDHARAGAFPLRVPTRRVPVRRAAARRLRDRYRPVHRRPGGRGEHPRGHRLPEDPVRCRPPHRRPVAAGREPTRRVGSASTAEAETRLTRTIAA
jgi:aspartyl-tRNA synthetase